LIVTKVFPDMDFLIQWYQLKIEYFLYDSMTD